MRYRELIEAPIADMQVVNKETEKYYNDFDKSDEGILNSQKGVQKIMNAFFEDAVRFQYLRRHASDRRHLGNGLQIHPS